MANLLGAVPRARKEFPRRSGIWVGTSNVRCSRHKQLKQACGNKVEHDGHDGLQHFSDNQGARDQNEAMFS